MRCCFCNKFVKKEGDDVRHYDGYACHVVCGDEYYQRFYECLDDMDKSLADNDVEMFQAYMKHLGLIGKVSIQTFIEDYIRKHHKPKRRGGRRPGAGRKAIGSYRSIGMTLPDEHWKVLDEWIEKGEFGSYTEYFRHLHQMNLLHVETVNAMKGDNSNG